MVWPDCKANFNITLLWMIDKIHKLKLLCNQMKTILSLMFLSIKIIQEITCKYADIKIHCTCTRSTSFQAARTFLQYRRHSPNREILFIGRQFCLRFRRLSFHREDRFSSEKTKRWCALQSVFARLTTVVFRWR